MIAYMMIEGITPGPAVTRSATSSPPPSRNTSYVQYEEPPECKVGGTASSLAISVILSLALPALLLRS